METESRLKVRVLEYVKHLVLVMSEPDFDGRVSSSLAFRYVRPKYMRQLNEITMYIQGEHQNYRKFFKGLAQYAHPVKLNLYIPMFNFSFNSRWTRLPMLKDIDTCKTLNIQSLTLRAHQLMWLGSVIESIRDFKNLRKLCLTSVYSNRPGGSLEPLSAMSAFFHELENLEHLTLYIPADGFVWNLPPKVWHLDTHMGLFRNLPDNKSMFSSITVLELSLENGFSRNTPRLDFVPPFTSLKSLALDEINDITGSSHEFKGLIFCFVASNPGLINIGIERGKMLHADTFRDEALRYKL